MKIAELQPFLDKTVKLHMTDGEIAKVRVDFLSDEYEDITVDVLETSRPDRYQVRSASYTFAAADIVSVVEEQ
jgi:hypothetical protein